LQIKVGRADVGVQVWVGRDREGLLTVRYGLFEFALTEVNCSYVLITETDVGRKLNDALKGRERPVIIPEFVVSVPQRVVVSPVIWAYLNRLLISLDCFILLA
jgi:hypothetical protein